MATFSAILTPSTQIPTKITALAGTTASSTITFNTDAIIAIVATGAVNVTFFKHGGSDPTAAATGWLIPSGMVAEFDLGMSFDSVAIYNPGASAVDVYILQLVKA